MEDNGITIRATQEDIDNVLEEKNCDRNDVYALAMNESDLKSFIKDNEGNVIERPKKGDIKYTSLYYKGNVVLHLINAGDSKKGYATFFKISQSIFS